LTTPTTRRTQSDRSATTKAALADAAIEVLIEKGWAAATAIEVCNRVGLTRGAFHHHYKCLPELLADALRRLYAEMVHTGSRRPVNLVEVIDSMWASIGNPRFKAVIEAWLAMANDSTLQVEIGPVVAEFATLVNQHGEAPVIGNTERRDFLLAARETMIGLALGRATTGGKPLGHERKVIARIRAEATALEQQALDPKRRVRA